ncbi:MAG TPA: hypothetical protein VKV04_07445 [Verrucomicrobiae bacterium]|nr:hypothetical protein [Verrucomicrobiae bacterium]
MFPVHSSKTAPCANYRWYEKDINSYPLGGFRAIAFSGAGTRQGSAFSKRRSKRDSKGGLKASLRVCRKNQTVKNATQSPTVESRRAGEAFKSFLKPINEPSVRGVGRQTMIELPINPATSLVDLNFVRLVRRIPYDEISRQIDSGKFIFVWDVSARGETGLRQFRFYLPEVVTPQMTARLSHEEVMERILPSARNFFWSAEIGQLLLLSRVTTSQLARQLKARLVNRTFKFPRENLTAWLRRRWLGGGNPNPCNSKPL